jgi:hypothetical protein
MRATQLGSLISIHKNTVIARPPGPREARPEDKLYAGAPFSFLK